MPAPWRAHGGSATGATARRLVAGRPARPRRLVRAHGAVGRVRVALDDLEGDDGDVVVAAGAIRGVDERARGLLEIAVGRLEHLQDVLVAEHRREAVGTEQEEVARLGDDGQRVDVDVRVGAEHTRDHRPLRVVLRLLLGQPAAAHELGDERVVGRQLLERAAAQEIGARVAHVRQGDGAGVPSTSATVIVLPIPAAAGSSRERR